MGGGLLQLVAYGAQDAYISGNPQITFWKGLFKRHTNFAMEPFRINFSGQIQWGSKQTALVGRHADLLYSTYIEVVLPREDADGNTYYWNNDQGLLGYNLLKYVELDIGGQIIDRMYSEFMVIWSQLTMDYAQALIKLRNLVSGAAEDYGATRLRYGTGCGTDGRKQKVNVLYVPLPFFFTRNPGAALPLIALQYHEVKINVLWNDPQFIAGNFTGTAVTGQPPISKLPQAIQAAIYIDYIYLDTEERRRMAQASHEYLIEQTQYNEEKGVIGANNRIDLTFNHPVKELIWVVQSAAYTDCRIAAGIVNTGYSFGETVSYVTPPGTGSAGRVDVVWESGRYTVTVSASGSGYVVGNSLTVAGGRFTGGSTPANDLTFTVTSVSTTGGILSVNSVTGTPPTTSNTRLKPFTYDIDPIYEQWIQINGQDRMDRRYGDYFSKVQAFQHHTGIGVFDFDGTGQSGVYSYSFALRPEEHQPSGTCNFSRIDTATIVMNMAGGVPPGVGPSANDSDDWNVRVYAINYNVLRVMSGMGGLAYSN